MKKVNGKIVLVSILFAMCLLTACGEENTNDAKVEQTSYPTSSPQSQAIEPSEEPRETDNNSSDTKKIEIYTVDMEQMLVSPLKVNVAAKDMTPKKIVNLVIDNIDEKVGVKKVYKNGKDIVVVFKSDMAPLKGCNGKMEEMILECIANSLLDNISSCEGVVFQSDKGAYESGHFSFDLNEEYATK